MSDLDRYFDDFGRQLTAAQPRRSQRAFAVGGSGAIARRGGRDAARRRRGPRRSTSRPPAPRWRRSPGRSSISS